MKTRDGISLTAAAILTLMLCTPASHAWDRYSTNRANNCATCHGNFRWENYISLSDGENWGDLHELHRSDMLNGDCFTCHKGDFFPVLLDESDGGLGLEAISCGGCHGRSEDIGDTSGRGAGLRQHHWRSGISACLECHDDANPDNYTPVGETVAPAYYFTPDNRHPNKPTDPCNPNGGEDFAGIEEGLDNDGDDQYDGDDPDCAACVPAPDGDVDFNGVTDFDDLLVVLSLWGTSGPAGDGDCDGDVDFDDLLLVLSGWD